MESPVPPALQDPEARTVIFDETIQHVEQLKDLGMPAEASVYSPILCCPSWHPALLIGEKAVIMESRVAMELSSSVASTWLNNVAYVNNESITPKRNGTLWVTNFRLAFLDIADGPSSPPNSAAFPRKPINLIPLHTIGNISIVPVGKDESLSKTLQLWCKDWRLITLTFDTPAICSDINKKLSERIFSAIENVFAFCQQAADRHALLDTEHIMQREFVRLQLFEKWRLTDMNQDYVKIPTYPSFFIVPSSVSDAVLKKVAHFRCNQRIPAVCWVSPTGASISRSSQPLVGIWAARSEDDEMLVRGIFANNDQYTKRVMYIMDCRPKLSAVGNMAKGLGYEKPEGYSEHVCEIMWMGIDNIHTMRESLKNMYKLCLGSQSDHKWLSNLEYTRWLDHLNSVIASSLKVAEAIQQGSSVLVHCSDGWDRTPQITSLAQLLLDPYYRTLAGFLALITKEWISFGHKFQLRVGHGCSDFWNNEHCSPIFLQWVDCVWQVMNQYPQCFEFNEKLLIDLLDNLYNCYFGEFLFNSEREMMEWPGCPSLWRRYLTNTENFLNPFYSGSEPCILQPDPSPKRLRFWTGYYMRFYQPTEDGMNHIHKQGMQLRSECTRLTEELSEMKAQLEREAKVRNNLERKLKDVIREKETEDVRRQSFECKVMSEGEGTLWCKIGVEDLGSTTAHTLKRIHIIEDYDPCDGEPHSPVMSSSDPFPAVSAPYIPSSHSHSHNYVPVEPAAYAPGQVSPKRKNSRAEHIDTD